MASFFLNLKSKFLVNLQYFFPFDFRKSEREAGAREKEKETSM